MQYSRELKLLETYNMSEKQKIKLIENLYKLAHIHYSQFVKNKGKKIF